MLQVGIIIILCMMIIDDCNVHSLKWYDVRMMRETLFGYSNNNIIIRMPLPFLKKKIIIINSAR